MTIDLERIRGIDREYAALDPLDAYYRKRGLDYRTVGPLVPQTAPVLRQALQGVRRAIDVGCGDGQTLLGCSVLLDSAVGFDESAFALDKARADAQRRGIRNVEFIQGKAVSLPFAEASFDFVFSERGPLGHSDITLAEALRVLSPGGRIFVETGAWSGPERTVLTNLDEERDRFERHGVALEILASRLEEHHFPDLYAWFEFQGIVWRYLEQGPPFPYTEESLREVVTRAGGADSEIVTTYHTIWIGGRKL